MSIKIIQIDDDFINNMANERLLKKMGVDFTSKSFLDPTEALDYLAGTSETYDLMLLDINMPRINGWEFLELYKDINKHMPIIMLTSSLDPNDQKRAKNSKLLTGFFIKPLSKDMMFEIFELCKIEPTMIG
ncbi:MAG: response regulator [Bacteroidia bacterium]|nr:response regulator [Bacteroidia bacterium]